MARLISSENGIENWFDYDPIRDQVLIQTREDVTPLLERMNEERKQELWAGQVKKDMVHFCKLPLTVDHELMKKGIDTNRLSDPNTYKRFVREITANYPYLLAHQGKRFA
jgi:hypothetical protein